jgi:hypothetical protein
MKITFKTMAILFAFSLAFSSCRKDEREALEDVATSGDNEQAEGMSDEASNIADNAAKLGNNFSMRTDGSTSAYELLSQCATVTHDTVSNPRALTIDFGTTNCLCNDGRYRRGKILVTYTGRYFDIGSVRTINFDNFYRNDNKVEGTRTVTNNGLNSSGQYNWTINASNMKITRTDGTFHTWSSTRTRTMTAGQGTAQIWSDDEYTITGSASGTNRNGIAYTANITTPLHRAMSCRWIDSGVITISPTGKAERELDYGSGNCDNEATIRVGNRTKTITLN